MRSCSARVWADPRPADLWDGKTARGSPASSRAVASRRPLPRSSPRITSSSTSSARRVETAWWRRASSRRCSTSGPTTSGLARGPARRAGGRPDHPRVVHRLNSSFVTPIDGEDIYGSQPPRRHRRLHQEFRGLPRSLRDRGRMEQSLLMADVLVKACGTLAGALEHLRRFKASISYWSRSTGSERGRSALPRADRVTVRDGIDPIVVIRWKDRSRSRASGRRRDGPPTSSKASSSRTRR